LEKRILLRLLSGKKKYSTKADSKYFSESHDYVLMYAKAIGDIQIAGLERTQEQNDAYKNPDNDSRGEWTSGDLLRMEARDYAIYEIIGPTGIRHLPPAGSSWRFNKDKMDELISDNRVWFGEDGNSRPRLKRFLTDVRVTLPPQTLWTFEEVGHSDEAKKEVAQIFSRTDSPFATPKPMRLIQRILEIGTKKDSIILDSFAGSATTAHAVLAQNKKDGGNRRFILCEMEDYADTLTAERVRRVINGYEFQGTVETELCPPEKVTWTTFGKDSKRKTILDRIEGIENLERGNYDKIEKKITDGVLTVVGQKQVTEKVPGLGGSFTFVELGEPMDLDRLLSENPGELPSFESLARYLFFTVTGQTLEESPGHVGAKAKKGKAVEPDGPVLIGEAANLRVYLDYKASEEWLRSPAAAFTRLQAEEIANKRDKEAPGKNVLVIAASKYVSHQTLQQLRVDFAQLPYALHRIQAG
jgi:adenine-specific DNA-methyltransferase